MIINYISENIGTIAAALVLACILVCIIVYLVKKRRKNESVCGCCSSCPMSGSCGQNHLKK